MEKRKRTNWVKSLWAVLGLMTGIPGIVQADLRDILLKFQPYLGVQEEYTNNVNLTPQNKKTRFYHNRLWRIKILHPAQIRDHKASKADPDRR